MSKSNYRVKSVSVEMPALIVNGLEQAATKFKINRSEIIRSVVYDFLVSSGILPENEYLDRPEDIYVEPIGRMPTLLAME